MVIRYCGGKSCPVTLDQWDVLSPGPNGSYSIVEDPSAGGPTVGVLSGVGRRHDQGHEQQKDGDQGKAHDDAGDGQSASLLDAGGLLGLLSETKPETMPTTQETPKKKGTIPATEQTREATATPFVCRPATEGDPVGPPP